MMERPLLGPLLRARLPQGILLPLLLPEQDDRLLYRMGILPPETSHRHE